MGNSVGHWEWNTLVVETTNLRPESGAGGRYTDAAKIVERFTRTAQDTIAYEVTIEDPNVFTRPWKISVPLYRRLEKNAQIMEFRCVEFVEELIYGPLRKKPTK